ncbi:HoxN/HupN/NixA family nickel/cobalt transporter [Kribbella sp. NBC_01510]|uniref:HoxN/HupN/NixA family nickel/cobalt transporter n=1 Tax=Kribbella sp. NBC_01510 TaxID=2903581 RepID=UPI00386FB402
MKATLSSTRRSIAAMAAFILLLHVTGWGLLVALVAPGHYSLGASGGFGVGLGLTAYTLGMRHAFDADHIAAIDNTTRRLTAAGQRPVSVGFWFSLGHSSVVFGLCLLLAFGVRSLVGQVEDDSSTLQSAMGLIGTAVSGVFLVAIGLVNFVVLARIAAVVRRMRKGYDDEAELEAQLDRRGLLNRLLRPVTKAVHKPRHMYPVGLLFGLGFDTATEVSLLVLAGGAAAFALPWYAVLVLPILFAAGMSLLDTIDGCFMSLAYRWAVSKPVRRAFYNLVVTALSVAVALVIGTIEIVSIVTDQLDIRSGPLPAISRLDLNHAGYVITGAFVATWAVALLVWRYGRIEDRWSTRSS